MIQTCNFIKKSLHHRYFPVTNVKFWRILILKNICDWFLLKIYLLLLWFFEKISEVAFCRHSTKSTHPKVCFQQSCWSLTWNFINLKTASQIFFDEFCKIFILRTPFLEYTPGQLFLIFRKLHIQTLIRNKFFHSINIVGTLYFMSKNADFVKT